ncbi:DUF1569 domain-containing protein [Yeosuana sp. MJ-SS3]|uniref:DUF1569 domain-containing protein n=1 Tax=Gilvirhabdus luticola TaxID=3079858 RepID=A0ABU3U9I1_9FLAO|nr:DUF1569 domain-containing protein [Yeosuana sp. MJ-SS3]MDU8887059.1 DUF1569 domain-containing protein [Yeosuana sp. MJ-SS3]
MSETKSLSIQLIEVESYFKYKDVLNNKISDVSVGWQIYHILKVINVVADSIKVSRPEDYKTNLNEYREKYFTKKYLPRGVARAPKGVLPPESFSLENLNELQNLAKQNVHDIETLESHANFVHFIFGLLNKRETQLFLEIHTEHHLKIIRDILNTK